MVLRRGCVRYSGNVPIWPGRRGGISTGFDMGDCLASAGRRVGNSLLRVLRPARSTQVSLGCGLCRRSRVDLVTEDQDFDVSRVLSSTGG